MDESIDQSDGIAIIGLLRAPSVVIKVSIGQKNRLKESLGIFLKNDKESRGLF